MQSSTFVIFVTALQVLALPVYRCTFTGVKGFQGTKGAGRRMRESFNKSGGKIHSFGESDRPGVNVLRERLKRKVAQSSQQSPAR